MVVVYKWGGIAFDDKSLIKTLTLPSDADGEAPITYHDEADDNYVVPGGKVFICGLMVFSLEIANILVTAGESDGIDAAITKPVVAGAAMAGAKAGSQEVIGIFAAGKYVNGSSSDAAVQHEAGSKLYGVEIDA